MRGFHFSLAVIDHYAKKYWRPHKRQKSKKFNFCKKIYHVKKLSDALSDTNTISVQDLSGNLAQRKRVMIN